MIYLAYENWWGNCEYEREWSFGPESIPQFTVFIWWRLCWPQSFFINNSSIKSKIFNTWEIGAWIQSYHLAAFLEKSYNYYSSLSTEKFNCVRDIFANSSCLDLTLDEEKELAHILGRSCLKNETQECTTGFFLELQTETISMCLFKSIIQSSTLLHDISLWTKIFRSDKYKSKKGKSFFVFMKRWVLISKEITHQKQAHTFH